MNLTSKKITELDLPFVKEYLKVDYDEEDTIIETLIISAVSYIETMLGFRIREKWESRDDIPDELTIAALLIIAHWFDNRQMQITGTTLSAEIKFALSAIIDAHKDHFKEYDEEKSGNFDGIIL